MRPTRLGGALVVALALAAPAHAQRPPDVIQLPPDAAAPQVSAAASPSDIKLGARFTLFVTAVYDAGVEVNLHEPVALGSAFEVKRKVSDDHVRADGRHVRDWQLDVYAWELGEISVPPVVVTFIAAGRPGEVQTNAVPVRVVGVLGDVDDPKLVRDRAGPVALVGRAWFWLWLGGGAGALVAGAIALVWRRRRRRRRVGTLVGGVAMRPRRIDMTSERALERLLAIEKSGVIDRDDQRKAGYAEMTEVVREYIGARFGLLAVDLTSSELLGELARAAPERDRRLVEAWLGRCDVVKYGGRRATTVESYSVLDSARKLVVATTSAARVGES